MVSDICGVKGVVSKLCSRGKMSRVYRECSIAC